MQVVIDMEFAGLPWRSDPDLLFRLAGVLPKPAE